MSDPHIQVFHDTVYFYCGHDSSPDDVTWITKDWRVFSTTDLVNWISEGTISPKENYMDDASTDYWAGDAATRNGEYYFYFSDRKRGIGVMRSESPKGPYMDALGKPLLSPIHDPTIVIDDDPNKTPYIIYEPYECVGAVGNGHHLNEFAHGSFFMWKGQFYHIWYYLRNGYKYHESIITYCHFDENGAMVTDTDFLDKHFTTGVGQYDASWPETQAEWYYKISHGIKKEGTRKDGFVLTDIKDGSWVKFANMNFERRRRLFEASISLSGGNGNIEIRADSLTGSLLRVATIYPIVNPDNHQVISCELGGVTGKRNILVKFNGDEKSTFKFDWFNLTDSVNKVNIY